MAGVSVPPSPSPAASTPTAGATGGNAALAARDLRHVWHPCTQMHDHERYPPIPIHHGRGPWLHDYDGRRYLDGISSWWTNLFGHAHPEISAAVARQASQLEHVLLAGFTHEPAVQLAEQLTRLAPEGLSRCFFADNGSAAVEVALKMSFHYWQNVDQPAKRRFVTLTNSYHGETLGALAVGDVALYKQIYRPLLLDVLTAPSPDAYGAEPGESAADCARRRGADMDALLARHAGEIAAVIVEPLVQCAGTMRMYDPLYLRLLREACDRHGVHLIADEIAVGFGRTGTLFACEQAGIRPDFMCLSKGLTGGYLPLSAVLTGEDVYAAFYAEYVAQRAFLHSHSYTGNPLACAAALATLAQFARGGVLERNRAVAARMAARVAPLRDHPHVADVRQTGMILAVEFVRDRATRMPYDWTERRGLAMHRHALAREVLLRPIGDVIYAMPPYVLDDGECDLLVDVLAECVDSVCRD
jgi:adenosylmethionine---8-amino-7-oxononanoate aminotransferase